MIQKVRSVLILSPPTSHQVSSYHPGMTGVQVTRAPQTASQHMQARLSYKRTDTKKGKKK